MLKAYTFSHQPFPEMHILRKSLLRLKTNDILDTYTGFFATSSRDVVCYNSDITSAFVCIAKNNLCKDDLKTVSLKDLSSQYSIAGISRCVFRKRLLTIL